jgi:hypothetical protein
VDGAASFTATITWGDGSPSAGLITGGGGAFTVTGAHTFAAPGQDAVRVTISHVLNYTETATATATVGSLGLPVQRGLTGGIFFWQSGPGQSLINNFGGGPASTALVDWLAASYPNLYGAGAGANDLTGRTNVQVAAFYRSQFAPYRVKAQVLATALSVYASTSSLGGSAGAAYGFLASTTGLGARSVNVAGVPFVGGATTLNVYQLLLVVDEQAVAGVLFNGNPVLQQAANNLFGSLNTMGSIWCQPGATAVRRFFSGSIGLAFVGGTG